MTRQSPSQIEPVSRLKVADSVAAQLVRLVTSGSYRPGERLPAERDLAAQFGVGRSSMREALRIVEADGLLRIEHGVGAFVQERDKRDGIGRRLLVAGDYTVPELFELRLPLERDAAGLAARRSTEDEIVRLQAILAEAGDPDTSDDRFIELDAELHRTIARATRNALFHDVMASMEPLFFTYSRQVMLLPDRRARAHAGHERIVAAIAGRRVREARAAAVSHIHDVERDLVSELYTPGEHVNGQ
jgi:GntR family transcriptional repressor for pyruvate dehydrogenase complex